MTLFTNIVIYTGIALAAAIINHSQHSHTWLALMGGDHRERRMNKRMMPS